MPRPTTRSEALARLRNTLDSGKIIIGAGAGVGLSAKLAEKAGADFIVLYNSGLYRMHGLGSLAGLMPYGDANAIVCDMAQTVLPQVKSRPVVAGVCATDPFRDLSVFLPHLRSLGFIGIQNFPTVGLIDGNFRQNLEDTGMSYAKEVAMIKLAHSMDFLTVPYVFTVEQAVEMTKSGADVLVVHFGLTAQGTIGARNTTAPKEAADTAQKIRDAVTAIRGDIIVLVHGGYVANVDDFKDIMERTIGIQGFLGASTFERIPLEDILPSVIKDFKMVEPQ
ncbi:hypothetical protein TWF281_000085 [Arthrobotrys megalospora]